MTLALALTCIPHGLIIKKSVYLNFNTAETWYVQTPEYLFKSDDLGTTWVIEYYVERDATLNPVVFGAEDSSIDFIIGGGEGGELIIKYKSAGVSGISDIKLTDPYTLSLLRNIRFSKPSKDNIVGYRVKGTTATTPSRIAPAKPPRALIFAGPNAKRLSFAILLAITQAT